MRYFSIILFALFIGGCSDSSDSSNDDSISKEKTSTAVTTKFFDSVSSVLNQSEDDEPLSIDDNLDESSSFDSFL